MHRPLLASAFYCVSVGAVLAGTPPTAVMKIVPVPAKVGAYPAGTTIVDNELTAITGGFRAWFEFKLSDWDPNGDGNPPLGLWAFRIDSTGYLGANADPPNPGVDLAPPVTPCTNSAKCVAEFGETWAVCDLQSDTCVTTYVNSLGTGRPDAWCANTGGGNCGFCNCDVSSPSVRCGCSWSGPAGMGRPDEGIEYFAASVMVDIPWGARGRYAVNLVSAETGLFNTAIPATDIPTLEESGFVVNIVPRPCTGPADCPGDGIFCNGIESCDSNTGTCQSPSPCLANQVCDEAADACLNFGACCRFNGIICSLMTEPACTDPPPNGLGGDFLGAGSKCPTQALDVPIPEGNGTVFVHTIQVPRECAVPGPSQGTAACPPSGPYADPWVSQQGTGTCHNFGSPVTIPIPAGFFDPGSDPFTSTVCFRGVPLGVPEFGDVDTLISRSEDPFGRCDLPSTATSTVDIEVVALSLQNIDPIVVTYGGGASSQNWNVFVDLSPGGLPPTTPPRTLTATKTHCNGGTYTSVLYVQPRFTFTKISDPSQVRVLDTGMTGTPPVELVQSAARKWVSNLDPFLGAMLDPCSAFHANIVESSPLVSCDCNANLSRDLCDIEDGISLDCNANQVPDSCDIFSTISPDANGNGVPDECEVPPNIIWNPNPLSPIRGARSLTVSLSAAVATSGTGTAAIQVQPIDLQSPSPANPPCCPPQDFGAYESASCTAVGEGNGCTRWVGPPVTIREAQDNLALGTFTAARLQCTPYYTDWTTVGSIRIVGPEMMPSSTYELTAYASACKGVEASCTNLGTPVQALTRRSGDVAPPYAPTGTQPDPSDVVAVLNKFKNQPGAPGKAIAQIQPNVIELNVDVGALDIVATIDAFKGTAYPFSGPCPCPSPVTCNTTACGPPACAGGGLCVRTCGGGANAGQPCLNDNHCPGSACASTGFCRDRCGRCSP